MQGNRYLWLDLVRGLSAILVCAGHVRAAVFEPFSSGNVEVNLFTLPFYFITSLGHEAVMVFFVLSGFFVGGSVINKRDNFQFIEYSLIRLSRLWIVLLPSLLFTFIVDLFLPNLLLNGYYISNLNSGPSGEYSSSASTFLHNVVFLQTIVSPVYGSNGPLWSLANEFWYYILFPFFLYTFGYFKSNINIRLLSVIIIFTLSVFLGDKIIYGFFIWILGVFVYLLNFKLGERIGIVCKVVFIFQFLFSILFFKYYKLPFNDILVALSFSFFLLAILNVSEKYIIKFNFKQIIMKLSDMSYSLYLFHFPIVLLIYSLFFIDEKLKMNYSGVLIYASFMLMLILIGYVAWFLFERHSFIVRAFTLSVYKKYFRWGRL